MYETVRQFKGVWIPKEVWLDEKLTYFEKAVYAEIDSLDGDEGCFASNKYLAGFFGCTERHIKRALAHLSELGYVKTEMFDGRKRVIKICRIFSETEQMQGVTKMSPGDINVTAGVTKMSPQRGQECHPRNSYNIAYNIDYINNNNNKIQETDEEEKIQFFDGLKGLCLSDKQDADLRQKLSIDEYISYTQRLDEWKRSHPGRAGMSDYKIILKWAKEDRQTEDR